MAAAGVNWVVNQTFTEGEAGVVGSGEDLPLELGLM